jgi:hypothetical protein
VMVKINIKAGGLSPRSTVRCVKKVVFYSTFFTEYQYSPLLLSGALLSFPAKHVTAQLISPWAYEQGGPNRKAHLVPHVAITWPRTLSSAGPSRHGQRKKSFHRHRRRPREFLIGGATASVHRARDGLHLRSKVLNLGRHVKGHTLA